MNLVDHYLIAKEKAELDNPYFTNGRSNWDLVVQFIETEKQKIRFMKVGQ